MLACPYAGGIVFLRLSSTTSTQRKGWTMPLILSLLDALVRNSHQLIALTFIIVSPPLHLLHSTPTYVAGGLAVYLHADFVMSKISPAAKYRAFADAGYVPLINFINFMVFTLNCVCTCFRYFLDMPNINGSTDYIEKARKCELNLSAT